MSPTSSAATVLICDDDARIRDALRLVISAQPDLTLAAIACDRDEAVRLAGRRPPTVAIIDVRMPGGGARTAREIRRLSPDTGILAYSAYEDPGAIAEMHQAGATEYLVKGVSLRELLAAVRRLAHSDAP